VELWGGHECTVNRVGDQLFDQTVRSGHQDRIADLDLFADLGLKALRYPALWERMSPDRPDAVDFVWTDARLNRIRELGMRPILGLIHHGSGPAYTHLLDDAGFAAGLAMHARNVVRRYPWVEAWTPVNEPLTTARFSALYGHWYPHARDEGASWRALLNQIDGVRLAMAEIRKVNPAARLVQTEDLGFTFSTPLLADQAHFENDRRWLTWDLLFGRVGRDHPLWTRLCGFGLGDRLRAIADAPCAPDVVGVNHYLTSERFLDHRIERYPAHVVGGNDRRRYADVEAVRAVERGPLGLETLLAETWARYGAPLAVTECHNGSTRDEQVRWLWETWRSARALAEDGVDLRAVTAWSLLGSLDWNSLLTADKGHYECGVFDLRGGTPRPTAAAALLKRLARGDALCETPPTQASALTPALASPGWWRRPEIRFVHPPVAEIAPVQRARPARLEVHPKAAPVVVLGASGLLGQAIGRACRHRGLPVVLASRKTLRVEDARGVSRLLDRLAPSALINAAGFTRIDESERHAAACHAANAIGPEVLARACAARGVPLVTLSSDLVFDGELGRAYLERDPVSPRTEHGRNKALGEAAALAAWPQTLVVRSSAFFCWRASQGFAVRALDALSAGRTFEAAEDAVISPTYVPDLADAILDLLIDAEHGVWHLASRGRVSRAAFARRLAERAGLDPARVVGRPAARLGFRAARPADVSLDSERGVLLPDLDDAISRFLEGYGPALSLERTAGGRSAAA
jgi:dTDP-4-dehydrorhamnose reductase